MKKTFILILVMLMGFGLFSFSQADETRTIARKSKVITANEVTSTQGVTLYKVTGYANAANAVYGLYNTSTLGAATASTCKVEGGEATQYDSLPILDFGDEGITFSSGLVVVTNGAYVTIEYI